MFEISVGVEVAFGSLFVFADDALVDRIAPHHPLAITIQSQRIAYGWQNLGVQLLGRIGGDWILFRWQRLRAPPGSRNRAGFLAVLAGDLRGHRPLVAAWIGLIRTDV